MARAADTTYSLCVTSYHFKLSRKKNEEAAKQQQIPAACLYWLLGISNPCKLFYQCFQMGVVLLP